MNTGLTRYVARRLIQAVFLMLLITVLNFTIMRLAPGGPAQFAEDPTRQACGEDDAQRAHERQNERQTEQQNDDGNHRRK